MALHGKGMLVVFAEAKPAHERDLNEWYNREHIDERVNMPGFRRARRYVALRGGPKYLATYECSKVGDLAAPGYLAGLAKPTPWTARVTGRFSHFTRLTLALRVDQAHGIGGILTVVRFFPEPGRRSALVRWLRERALPKIIAKPGLVGAAAGENDLDVANAPIAARSQDRPRAEQIEWVVLIDGSDPDATHAAASAAFRSTALKPFGVAGPPAVATYRLLFGNDR